MLCQERVTGPGPGGWEGRFLLTSVSVVSGPIRYLQATLVFLPVLRMQASGSCAPDTLESRNSGYDGSSGGRRLLSCKSRCLS